MIPGELIPAAGEIELNTGREAITLMVANTGDRPVQVGSHYHFYETNPALDFDREAAKGLRLDIAPGTAVRFEPGQALASVSGQASANVNRAAATLPDSVREQLTRKRKAGDQDAAVDPLSTPEVRQAVLSASFEALVGFQLTQEQLEYNVRR